MSERTWYETIQRAHDETGWPAYVDLERRLSPLQRRAVHWLYVFRAAEVIAPDLASFLLRASLQVKE